MSLSHNDAEGKKKGIFYCEIPHTPHFFFYYKSENVFPFIIKIHSEVYLLLFLPSFLFSFAQHFAVLVFSRPTFIPMHAMFLPPTTKNEAETGGGLKRKSTTSDPNIRYVFDICTSDFHVSDFFFFTTPLLLPCKHFSWCEFSFLFHPPSSGSNVEGSPQQLTQPRKKPSDASSQSILPFDFLTLMQNSRYCLWNISFFLSSS